MPKKKRPSGNRPPRIKASAFGALQRDESKQDERIALFNTLNMLKKLEKEALKEKTDGIERTD